MVRHHQDIDLEPVIRDQPRLLRLPMQDFEFDTIPLPMLTGHATRRRAQALQRMVALDRTQQGRLGLHCQHRRRTASVVAVTMAQHDRIQRKVNSSSRHRCFFG